MTRNVSQRQHRYQVLYHIADLINSTTNSTTLLRRILRETVHTFEGTGGAIWTLDEERQELELSACFPTETKNTKAISPEERELVDSAFNSGKPGGLKQSEAPRKRGGKTTSAGILVAPLRIERQTIGVISVRGSLRPELYEEDIRLLTAVASQASRIIHTARLMERQANESQQLERLITFGQIILAHHPLADLLPKICEMARQLTGVHQCTLLLLGKNSEMQLSASSDSSGSYSQRPAPIISESVIGQVKSQGQPVRVYDVRRPANAAPGRKSSKSEAATLLAVPLFHQQDLVGILNLYSSIPRQYQSHEMRIIQAFASLCGTAIYNGQHIEHVLKVVDDLNQTGKYAALNTWCSDFTLAAGGPFSTLHLLNDSLTRRHGHSGASNHDHQVIAQTLEEVDRLVERLGAPMKLALPRLEWVSIDQPLLDALALLGHAFSAQRIVVQQRLASHLPLVLADMRHLRFAFYTVLRNSLVAMPGGGMVTIQTVVQDSEDSKGKRRRLVRGVIRDTGHGISTAVGEHLFQPIFGERPPEIGWGLLSARRLIEPYGGRITVRSSAGGGTICGVSFRVQERPS